MRDQFFLTFILYRQICWIVIMVFCFGKVVKVPRQSEELAEMIATVTAKRHHPQSIPLENEMDCRLSAESSSFVVWR